MKRLAVLALLLGAGPALAQAGGEDPRVKTIDYNAGTLFHIPTAPGMAQTVLFAPDERVSTVLVSNPAAYQVSVPPGANGLVLRAAGAGSVAVVSVRTDRRQYELELVPSGADPAKAPLVVRFSYDLAPGPARVDSSVPPAVLDGVTYRFKGAKTLRPATIGDDGRKTYITWPKDAPMPAVFAQNADGREEMVEGYVRAGRFTIDRVYDRLVFKIDKLETRAQRIAAGSTSKEAGKDD